MKKYLFIGLMLVSYSTFAESVYRLETKMGDSVFADLLVIDSYQGQTFEGSLTVPGAFTSKIYNTGMADTYDGKRLGFDIKVHENNEDYSVRYSITLRVGGSIDGTISQDNKVIAQINGKEIYSGKK